MFSGVARLFGARGKEIVGRLAFTIKAVSYTHLDVYKRQDHGRYVEMYIDIYRYRDK